MDETKRELQAAKEARNKADKWWKIFLLAGVVCLIEVPLPHLQPWMAMSGAMIFLGLMGHNFYQAKRLPIREALLLGQLKDGLLSTSMLCLEFGLNPAEAKVMLQKMERQGLLKIDENALFEDGDMMYRIKGLSS